MPEYGADYYSPPAVPWWALFIFFVLVGFIARLFFPKPFSGFLSELVYQAWGIYLCLWIRRIEPNARSLFWLLAAIATNLIALTLSATQEPSRELIWVALLAGFAALVLWLVAVFVASAELQRHYTEKEPMGLYLGGIMTFFFSFIYFQYHLNEISDRRESIRIA
jgi:hypothetical protein